MSLLEVTEDGQFIVASTVVTIGLNAPNNKALIRALRGEELSPEQLDAAPEIIEKVLEKIIPPFKVQIEEQLNKAFKLESNNATNFANAVTPSQKKEDINKNGWVYYQEANSLGVMTSMIPQNTPHRELIISILKKPDDNTAKIGDCIDAMNWLHENTLKGSHITTLRNAFSIFPKEAQQAFFENYTPPRATASTRIPMPGRDF